MVQLIKDLKASVRGDLPGELVQFQMATTYRYRKGEPPISAKKAAVLLLLYPGVNAREQQLVLIKRIDHNRADHHRGQISLPGGRHEPMDEDLSFTALREANEEVGVNPHNVELIGSLTNLYVPVSNYLIHPYLGVATERPDFRAQPSEVREIIETPLHLLQDPEVRKIGEIATPSQYVLKDVPYFDIFGNVVWGATAMILNEFLNLHPFRSGSYLR
jgi:8-oxo-dGTP pyrophosphatase MutT (NUDIX family)